MNVPSSIGKKGVLNPAALLLLMAANLALTIGQFNIASLFFLISPSFKEGVTGLGFLTSSFYLAYGLFEVPGGILAVKAGPKRIAVVGTLIHAFGVLASGASPTFFALGVFRFAAGLGFSFAFPSSLVLIVRYYRQGSEGFGVGLMTFSSFLGGTIGLFGWSILGAALGWRPSVLIDGIICLGVGALMIFVLPPDSKDSDAKSSTLSDLKRIISSKTLILLGIAVFGIAAASGLTGNFLVYYLEDHLGASPGIAGLIGGLSSILPIMSGPAIGRAYDRLRNPRTLIIISAVSIAIGVSVTAFDTMSAAILSSIIEGLASGAAFTIILSVARETSSSDPRFESLSVAWVDSFSLYGIVLSPIYFSTITVTYGYSPAWLVGGLVAIILCVPLALAKSNLLSRQVSEKERSAK